MEAKGRPREATGAPKGGQWNPKGSQKEAKGRPREAKGRPKGGPGRPRGSQRRPRPKKRFHLHLSFTILAPKIQPKSTQTPLKNGFENNAKYKYVFELLSVPKILPELCPKQP